MRTYRKILLVTVCALAWQAPAVAQTEGEPARPGTASGNSGLGDYDIVVTATRQAEQLNRVPLSISAYSQETMDQQGVRDVSDIARLTPGVQFEKVGRFAGNQSNITVRGIRSNSGIPTTGIYIDETPVQVRQGTSNSLANPYPQVFDLDRVEVLRGPQGTLFGAGAVGGAVRFITPAPALSSSSFYGRAEVSFTEKGGTSYEGGLAAGIPIVEDKLGMRASVWYRHDGGFVDRVDRFTGALDEENANSSNSFAGRFALGWQATDRLLITPSIFFQDIRSHDTPVYDVSLSDRDNGDFRQASAFGQWGHDRFYLPALKVEYELDGVTIVSNTSYFRRKYNALVDDTTLDSSTLIGTTYSAPPASLGSPAPYGDFMSGQKTFTQELRLQNNNSDARLNWVVGAYYSHSRIDDYFAFASPRALEWINYGREQGGLAPVPSVAAAFFGVGLYDGLYSLMIDNDIVDEQIAAFAQFDFRVTDKLKLTAGARYTESKFSQDSFRAGPVIVNAGSMSHLSQEASPVTPKFGISYEPSEGSLLYANVAKGFRVGGAVNPVGARCGADAGALGFDPLEPRTIEPDSVWSYEIGAKTRLMDNRLSLDASAFRIDWDNIQTALILPNCGIPTTINFGDARSQGFNIAISARPVESLTLGAAIGYTDATYRGEFAGAGGVVLRRDGEPIGVSPWTIYLNGEYAFGLGSNEGYLRADYTHASADGTPLDLSSPLVNPDIPRYPETNNLDLRMGVRLEGFDVSAFVSNVTNQRPTLTLFEDSAPQNYFRATTVRPRTIGLTVTMRR